MAFLYLITTQEASEGKGGEFKVRSKSWCAWRSDLLVDVRRRALEVVRGWMGFPRAFRRRREAKSWNLNIRGSSGAPGWLVIGSLPLGLVCVEGKLFFFFSISVA